ncbi:sugar ABC transporter substrate-binding protein [Kocuria rosea]|uniref:Sugar ABC transporter substrate-binding protein n=2 Tax=Kocuria rosea TaxID=1275 RepID=A0A4R5Y6B6_KOCRO|nr:sugar ABC transporter substrate-binding protein [Kocuria rosea]
MSMNKTFRRRLTCGVAATAVLGLVTACTTTGAPQAGGGEREPVAKEDIVLVASVINTTNPYMASMIEGAEALSEELGVPLEVIDSQGSSQTQISKIQAILAEGKTVAMMVNTVASSDAVPIVNAVEAAGGYTTIWWNKPDNFEPKDEGDHFVAFQKHSGVESGQCTGEMLAEGIGGKGNIVALAGVLDSTTSQTRVAGLEDALKDYPDVNLLEVRPGNWDPQVAFQETESLIAKHGDQIDGVWAADDAMIIGAVEAMQKEGRVDEVKFASDGLYPPVIDMMESGMGNDAIVGETFHRGYMAAAIGLYTSYLAATGEITPSELPDEQRNSLFQLECVTPETLDEFTKYDDDIDGWIDTLVENGPWDTNPVPLVGAGPEKMP